MKIINIKDFGLEPNKKQDGSFSVLRAMQYCKTNKNTTILFPKGEYEFWPDLAYEKLYCISNHDGDELKRIISPLIDMKDITIDGQGSNFIFHGLAIPFALEKSNNVHIKNINIDWERPTHSQGEIICSSNTNIDIKISKEYPYEVKNNKVYFIGEEWKEILWGLIEIDKHTLAPAFGSGDNCLGLNSSNKYDVEEIAEGIIRVKGCFDRVPKEGNYLIFRHGKRKNPGIFINKSININLEEINIYHAPGMGVIAQKSENINLNKVNIKLNKNKNRVFTTSADATHFVNCKGFVEIKDCLFENQMDDATNVHGIYTKISKKINEKTVMVRLMHEQHKGVEFADEGDKVGFVRQDSMWTYWSSQVEKTEIINKDYTLITLKDELPEDIRINDGVENLTWNPNFFIKNCIVRSNRARGLLISTPGEVIIEDNIISVPGAAIKISGDVNSWYESGAVKNVLITNNHFGDCNYCSAWGKAVIDIDPEIKDPEKYTKTYHDNIKIINNTFETFNIGIVSGHSVGNIVFEDNIVCKTTTYPVSNNMSKIIEIKGSKA